MDLPHDTETIDDLSALAWVHDELRRSLEAAHKAMRRYLKEADALSGSDVDAVDPGVLRTARAQLHQGVGALELVGLPAAAQLLRASEAGLQKMSGRPVTLSAAGVEAIEQASHALLDYVARLLAGKPVSPVALFPQYKAVQALAGADRVHPADLWPHDWQWRDIAAESSVVGRAIDAPLRAEVESLTLALMRQPDGPAAATLSDLFAGLAAGVAASATHGAQQRLATLWQMASGFFEAQAQRLLQLDAYSKRVPSRLLAQLRISESGGATASAEVSQRLAQDLLFFCAQAASPGDGRRAPRLAAVRLAWNLARRAPVDYLATQLGRHDPAAIAQAKKRVAAVKESWSAVAGGEVHRLAALNEQFHLVGDSLKRLYPSGDELAQALTAVAAQTVADGVAPPPALAMDVATALLYLEASLEDADFDHPRQADRVQRLAQRVAEVRDSAEPQPLEAWMEDLYRRVSDRQTMGSVVQELRSALTEAEKAIDAYFRQPSARESLHPVPGRLNAMRGVFSVLGLDHASQVVVRMRDDVDMLLGAAGAAGGAAHADAVDRLASNLGALGFLIDMLNVQPTMAKSLFAFDPASGLLHSVARGGRGRSSDFAAFDATAAAAATPVEPRLIEQAQSLAMAAAHPEVPLADVARELERLSQEAMVADQPVLAETMHQVQAAFAQARDDDERQAVRDELAQAMADFVHTASEAGALDALPPAPPPSQRPSQPSLPTQAGRTGLEEDGEMLEVFLEEAHEVIAGADRALSVLASVADDLGEMTAVRRAFHTLKGSSRMVGLSAFGEAAWACEQLFNRLLADGQRAERELLRLTSDLLTYLADWVEAIGAHRVGGHSVADIQRAIDHFGLRGEHLALLLPSVPIVFEPGMQAGKASVQAPPAAAPAIPLVSAPMPLNELLPDLPSAADLELRPQAPGVGPFGVLLATDGEAAFELDLGDAAALPAAGPAASPPQAMAEADGELLAPDAVSNMMSLDFDAPAAHAPMAESKAQPTPEPTPGPAPEPEPVPEPESEPEPEPEPEPESESEPMPEPEPEPEPTLQAQAQAESTAEPAPTAAPIALPVAEVPEPEPYKMIGPLRVGIPLFNIYLNEADEQSRRLATEMAEWALELHRPVSDTAIALAHSLAGNSATVGFADLSHLARSLEHALARSQAIGRGDAAEASLFCDCAEEIRRLLHQFAAGFLKVPPDELVARLADHERAVAQRRQALAQQPDAADSSAGAHPLTLAVTPAMPQLPAPSEPVPAPAAPADAEAAAATPYDLAARALGQAQFHALNELEPLGESRRGAAALGDADDDDIDAIDALDAELFPIFDEEATELLVQLAARLRDWTQAPGDAAGPAAAMRTLHTLKGGARLAGAMRLGEMAHRLEAAVERLAARDSATADEVEALLARVDALGLALERLRGQAGEALARPIDAAALAQSEPQAALPTPTLPLSPPPAALAPAAVEVNDQEATPAPAPAGEPQIDWQRLAAATPSAALQAELAPDRPGVVGAGGGTVRVRAPLLDRMVNHAGEVSIARVRLESGVAQFKGSLGDLTENLERLRHQLREIELQAETQIDSRLESAKAEGHAFDPLEMDRFTRFQELTRMMAESVNDVATVQRSLQRTLQSAEDDLAAQARLTRDLQDDLLRTRMVEFESLSDRLYRVARQAAKELHKQVRLDLIGGSIEVDRGVLERMGGAFEHLLRNCVTHGIETPAARQAAGKDPTGQITVAVAQEGNEVTVEFRDDGAGLNLARIGERGRAMGLVAAGAEPSPAELAQLIFAPGFSTADVVTELAGRGIGMDVVRADVNALGGRIETATALGQGTSFRLVLPLTTAVTQVVMLRAGALTLAVPATLIEIVRRAAPAELAQAYVSGVWPAGDEVLPMFWLGALLQAGGRSGEVGGRTSPVVIVKSAQQRIALHVDEVLGNQEVVIKNLGVQLARVPGLTGVTLLASGEAALIYNPVALATLYGTQARAAMRDASAAPGLPDGVATQAPLHAAPLVLVVDDSLTVRRVTQRLLVREGYRVLLAKDGLDALDKLAEERPAVLLSDIEMPRMDGFDLVRNLRADARLRDLPVIMITSRIAQKHRDHAAELGVNHYLGKPYSEEDLLGLVARYAAAATLA